MKIKTENQIRMFDEAIMNCIGPVALIDSGTGKKYDLKIPAEKAEALARLPHDDHERLELFVAWREDLDVMVGFIGRLKREGGHDGETAATETGRSRWRRFAFMKGSSQTKNQKRSA